MVDFALDRSHLLPQYSYTHVDLDTSRQTAARPLVVSVATIVARKATLPRNALNLVRELLPLQLEHHLHFIHMKLEMQG
jgi:hypothetical protein